MGVHSGQFELMNRESHKEKETTILTVSPGSRFINYDSELEKSKLF